MLEPGDQAECVIINDDLPLTSLSVTKVIISDQGGTATLDDFEIRVDGLEVSWPDPGSTTGGSAVVADSPASYDLSEADLAGYQEGTWSCTDQDLIGVPVSNGGAFGGASVSVAEGRQVICSITNDDEAVEPETATLTLQKVVINDDGGTRVESEWTLEAAGQVTISGVTGDPSISGFDLPPGEYALSEAGPDDYESMGWTCSDGALAGNSLTLAGGEDAVCTIVNDDIGPKPDIQVRQTVSGEQLDCPAVIGKHIEFFVIVENNGDGEAESVALDDEWTWQLKPARPKGAYECRPGKVQRTFECKLGNIGPGGSKDLGFRFSVGGQAGQYACNRASARTIPESPESGYNEFELCFRLGDRLRMHGELGIAQIGVPYEGFIDFSGGEPDHALDPLPLGLPNDLAAEVVGNRIRVAGCPKNDPDRNLPSVSTVTLNLADDGACQVIEQDFLLGIENPPDCVLEDLVTIPVGQSGLPNPDTALPDESMQKVVVDSQRNRYLAGYTHIDQSYASDPNGAFLEDDLNYDIRLVKYRNRPDPDCLALGGSPDDCLVEWERRYDSGNDDLAYAVALNEQEGRIYLGGGSLLDTNAHSWWNAVLLEIDASTGCLIGSQAFSAGRGTTSFFYDIAVDDSRVYAVGERLFNPLRSGDAGALIGVFGQPAVFPSPPGQDCGDGDRIHIPTAQDGELDRAVFGQAELLHERIVTRGGAEPVVAYSVRPPLPDCESCEILVGGMSGTSGWIDTLDPAEGTLVSFKSITDFSVLDIALFNESVIAVGSSPGDDMRLYVFDRPGPDAASRLALDLGKGRLRGVTVDTNGYIYAAGKSNGNQGLIFKFDPDGGLIDRRELTGGSSLSFNDIAVFVPGTGTVAGHTEEAADGFGWLQVDFFCEDSCEGE